MFVVLSGPPHEALPTEIQAMAGALRNGGYPLEPRIWCDSARGLAVAGCASGILPEDVFDRQPYLDEATCFVAGGRIDNRDELAGLLGLATLEAATLADSELLFRAWQRWGAETARHVTGNYSFCAVDRRNGDLTALTDHYASSIVLYSQRGATTLVASQMGAMLAHPAVEAEPDLEALAIVSLPRMLEGRTSMSGIAMLEGGTLLATRGGNLSTRRWWQPQDLPRIRYRDARTYVEHARELFRDAIRAQIRTQIRAANGISIQMSGGLDSTLVAAYAATELRAAGRELAVYTAAPELGLPMQEFVNWDADEIAQAQAVVALHPNMELTILRPEGRCPLDFLAPLHTSSHTVPGSTSNLVWGGASFERAARRGSRVMLSGSHGNATVSLSDDAVLGQLFEHGQYLTALRLSWQDQQQGGSELWRTLARELRFRRRRRQAATPRLRHGFRYLQPAMAEAAAHTARTGGHAMRDHLQYVRFVTKALVFWGADSLAQYGIEQRDPTCDRRLIEAFIAFPPEALMAGGLARGMARMLGQGLVPDSVRLRRRRGSQTPEYPALITRQADRYRTTMRQVRESPAANAVFRLDLAAADLERICGGEFNAQLAANAEQILNIGLFLLAKGR